MPNNKVDIYKKEGQLMVKCENYKTAIKGQEADEYPLIPTIDKKNSYQVKTEDLRQALAQVVFAVSTSESRIELSGVLFHFQPERLVLAATDSYRLAEKDVKLKSGQGEEKKIIVPAKTVQELLRIISSVRAEEMTEEEREVRIFVTENQVMFSVDGIELISRLIEGQYPEYKQIIPQQSETVCYLERVELIRAVKAASIFSKSGINDINLDFPAGKNLVVITSASSQAGENVVELAAEMKGKDNGIVLNYKYLLDGLNNIDSERIKLETINCNTPCILRPEKASDYLYIIMPIKQ
ncbi:DNA polymerase III subunit beta [Candidatus Wolfebacteria bacterium RBG_13_41_7]|uniref:DNA polymerase III subunit beta n=1 Tax=Candidatus Wolfebacteria bacterium RBG_13_41_7 TaxID=1802554 RepID=A0A1F8DP89_9BACT|nr:MAG: DNA polymerase III subunit beta [Candidatus Wolfebacteria bacterium RBG_13_41_7]